MNSQDNYNHTEIESKWQEKWRESKIYNADLSKGQNKFYNLMMFPYPSAEGLHAGNMFAFTGSDVYGRFQRLLGKNVFEPIGLDGFGIHSENYALKVGKTPKQHAEDSEKNYYRQLHLIGNGFDWDHTVETYDPNYYRFTQWLFVQLFKAGLAYKKKSFVNWCPGCKTVLADEQIMTPALAGKVPPGYTTIEEVPEGIKVCERCGNIPERKELSQWYFRITKYADRLLNNLAKIDWSQNVKVAQKEWIGKKAGINITFKVLGKSKEITVFTTTPINFGATFLVVAPEYAQKQLLDVIPESHLETVSKYIKESLNKSEQQRKEEGKDKTGVDTGLFVENHVTREQIPVWIADFVLMDFGTGAVQGCPGHDQRDFEFAKKFNLPIRRVVVGKNGEINNVEKVDQLHAGEKAGVMMNSDFLNGVEFTEAMKKTMDHFESKGWGKRMSSYHLRDWLISRQRYWGPPIPMIFCHACAKTGKSYFDLQGPTLQLHKDQTDWEPAGWYPEENLPVELPDIEDFTPEGKGKGPLANHPEFYKVKCPACGGEAERETDVSDTFVDSSWYFLRYPSVDTKTSSSNAFDPEITKEWLPVDQYFGGAEHAVLHLMYARFITQVLHDLKYLSFEEPFPKFFAHGLIIKDGAKMSKSKGNVINPDEYIEKFGADALRLYLMFIGPMSSTMDFRDSGMEGMQRFILRVWKIFLNKSKLDKENQELTVKLHQTIKKVTNDISTFGYNTAISAMMEYVNAIKEKENYSPMYLKPLAIMLAPFAPHMTEETWEKWGENYSIHTSSWPKYAENLTQVSKIIIPVQVNGKVRGQIEINRDQIDDKDLILSLAKREENIAKWLIGQTLVSEIYVPGKIINFVTK